MIIADLSPIQLTGATLIMLLLLFVCVYIIARLVGWGVAQSWFEFRNKYGHRGRNKKKKEE